MRIVVGLGNPGPRYRWTRHNVGFMVLDSLAARLDTGFDREKYGGLIAVTTRGGEKVMLLKPLTFMNHSGDAVARAVRNNIESLDDLLIVVDDVHLPLGTLRLRANGSSGGHNGLKSIMERLGTEAFPRLRLGVGETAPGGGLTDHVLGRFTADEKPAVEKMISDGAGAVFCFLDRGIGQAMNEVN